MPLSNSSSGFVIRAKTPETAEILIYEDIGAGFFGDGMSAKRFAEELKALGKIKTIDLRINSFGGDVFDGLAIYRQLVDHPAEVTVHIDGIAASIASVIAMAGKEISIADSGFLMIHDASGLAMGNAATMREMADVLDQVTGSLADVYAARSGNAAPAVREWMSAETWFDAKDALARGFATTIAENMKLAARLDPERHKFRHLPAALAIPVANRDRTARLTARHRRSFQARGAGASRSAA